MLPGSLQASARCKMLSLYLAVKRRLTALSLTSGSGTLVDSADETNSAPSLALALRAPTLSGAGLKISTAMVLASPPYSIYRGAKCLTHIVTEGSSLARTFLGQFLCHFAENPYAKPDPAGPNIRDSRSGSSMTKKSYLSFMTNKSYLAFMISMYYLVVMANVS